jgi:hypothetical protein
MVFHNIAINRTGPLALCLIGISTLFASTAESRSAYAGRAVNQFISPSPTLKFFLRAMEHVVALSIQNPYVQSILILKHLTKYKPTAIIK